MRLFKFYKKPEEGLEYDTQLHIKDKYPLYAVAVCKKDAKKFREMRDMNKFIEIEEDVDEVLEAETLESLNKNAVIRASVLSDYELRTWRNKYTDDAEMDKVKVQMTEREYKSITDGYDESIIILSPSWWDQIAREAHATNYLSEKYRKALHILDFDLCMKFLLLSDKYYPDGYNLEDDYSVMDWQVDELSLFIHLYKGYLSLD